RLAGVEDGRGRPVRELDEATGEGGDAAEPAEQVERDALAAEDRTGRAFDLRDHGRDVRDGAAVVELRLDLHRGVECAEDGGRDGNTADDAGLLEQQLGAAKRVLGDERERRRVARADVLYQRRGDDAL